MQGVPVVSIRLWAACLAGLLYLGGGADLWAGEERRPHPDPAEALSTDRPLSTEERSEAQKLFAQVGEPDFEVREQARRRLLAYGPRALPVARGFEGHEEYEVGAFARRFRELVLLEYCDYLPTAPQLKETLDEPLRVFVGRQEPFAEAFRRFERSAHLKVLFPEGKIPNLLLGTDRTVEVQTTVRQGLRQLLQAAHLEAVPRYDAVVVVEPDVARKLRVQEHSFAMPSGVAGVQACSRMAQALAAFLGAEVQCVGGRLAVRGGETDLRRAARTIGLLGDSAPEGFWPAGTVGAGLQGLFEAIERPVAHLYLDGQEPLRAIGQVANSGHVLTIDQSAAALASQQPAIRLELKEMPLGLCLRWLQCQALAYDPQTPPQVRLRYDYSFEKPYFTVFLQRFEDELEVPETVGGASLAFLKAGTEAERRMLDERVISAVHDACEVFPCEPGAFVARVDGNRLLVRGPAPMVAQALEVVARWKETGQAPEAVWRKNLLARLEAEVAWSGTATAETVLSQLREQSGLNLMLKRGPDGRPCSLKVSDEEARLLPAGRVRAKVLLDRLAKAAGARWEVQWGAAVFSDGAPNGP